MKNIILYNIKEIKKETENFKEIDLIDLESYGSPSHETFEFIKFSTLKIKDKTILEWFEEDGTSFWWFSYQTIFPRYNNAVQFINQFNNMIEKLDTKVIILKGCFDKIDLIQQICDQKKIKLLFSKKKILEYKILDYVKNKIKNRRYRKILKNKIKKRLSILRKDSIKSFPKNCFVITSPGVYRRKTVNMITGNVENQEFFIQPFLDHIKNKKLPLLCIDFDYTFQGKTKVLQERIKNNYNWIPVEFFLEDFKNSKTEENIRNLTNSLNELIKNVPKQKFVYKKIDLWDYLKPIFLELTFESHLPTYLKLIYSVEKIFKEIEPRKIIQVYETGPYAKSLEVAAKKLKIKTIGIQHGLIYPENPDYMHKEIAGDTSLGNPIPDITCVYGKYYKKILTESGNYPEDSVKVIGNPTFYDIQKIKSILSKEDIIKKYNIQTKKIVLIALSYRIIGGPKNNPDSAFLKLLYNKFKNAKNITFLIRPHPSDSENFEENFEENFSTSIFIISKNSLFEDIFVSDAVVTTTSAVGVDASIFDKPVFYVNMGNDENTTFGLMQRKMVEYKVAEICSQDEIIDRILSIVKNDDLEYTQSEKRKKFLSEYFDYPNQIKLDEIIFE